MFEFQAEGGGWVQLSLDFAQADRAELAFLDAARRDIPVQIVLDAGQGRAWLRQQSGGVWGAEHEAALPEGADWLRVSFDGAGLQVRAGRGAEAGVLFDLPADQVAGCSAIAWRSASGAVAQGAQIGGAANDQRVGTGGLVHAEPFWVEGWAVDRALGPQDVTLDLGALAEPPQPFVTPRPDLAEAGAAAMPVQLRVQLPGRIWASPGTEAGLRLRMMANGRPCADGVLWIARQDMARALDAVLAQPGVEDGTEPALLCLEHVHHGGFWGQLSGPARQGLIRIARAYRLETLLPPDAAAPPPAALADPEPDRTLAQAAFAGFGARLRADPAADLGAALNALPPLGPQVLAHLFTMLTEAFCQAGRFDLLAARAAALGLDLPLPGTHPWQVSTNLPWHLAAGRHLRLRQDLRLLAEAEPRAEISTAALAWVALHLALAEDPALAPDQREAAIALYLDVLEHRAASYWGRTSCQSLTQAAVALMQAAPRLQAGLAARVLRVVPRVHGLQPGFWRAHDQARAAGLVPDLPQMTAAGAAFAAIEAAAQRGAPLGAEAVQAVALFAALGHPDAARLRRELLGPLGLEEPAPAYAALAARFLAETGAGAETDAAGAEMLRAFAFPGATDALAPDTVERLLPLVRQAVAAAHDTIEHAPRPALQTRASQQIAAALTGALPALAPLFADLAALSRDQGLGLALALALADGLARRGLDAGPALARTAALIAALPADVLASDAVRVAAATLLAHQPSGSTAPALAQGLPAAAEAAARLPAAADPALATGALYDIAVIVISCRAYLDSRIPALQSAWLHQLDALGVPWVVAVGGASGAARREGHVLHLPVADDYEGLPAKVLAAFGWMESNSRAGHVLKIDDDCFVDAEGFLAAQSWRKFPYFGRYLARARGQTDRIWHQAKSTSLRGRMEVDKSPEPSSYCDGGSGYVLARPALQALGRSAASAAGQRLIAASFLEDKLVGDLLALEGIGPREEDHLVTVMRRSGPGATPVPVWANSFLPSRASGVRLAHLDRMEAQAEAAALVTSPALWPPKLWPSYAPPRLLFNSNALDLISPADKLARLNRAPVAVLATMRNERFMLPHFLRHYRQMGVECFLIADNLSDDGSLDYLLQQPDVVTFSVDTEYRVSEYGVAWQQALMSTLRAGRWSLVADADELLVTGQDQGLPALLAGPEFAKADAARVFMLDLYPQGPLAAATFANGGPFAEAGFCERAPFVANTVGRGPFGDQPTWTSALRHRLAAGSRPGLFVTQKLALLKYRPWMRLSAGLHYVAEAQLAGRDLMFAHFKYHAEFAAKARAEVARRQHFNDAEEYRKYLALLQEGRDVIFDPRISVPWRDSPDVRRLLHLD